jgi:hypothetical protein
LAGGNAPQDAVESVRTAARWLCAAQDATDCDGISRAYSMRNGWELPYPETTGYIIPTFLELDLLLPELKLAERAWRAGHWLAEVQFDSGAICSKQYRPGNTKPSVFNTGMVLHGWVSLLEARHDERIRSAACRAVKWLVEEQEGDGSWSRNAFNGIPHVYYTMVDWALVRYALRFDDAAAKAAAVRHLEWTLSNQRANGWYDRCWFHVGDAVTTHTISYTTQGLVESARLLGEGRYIESARRGTIELLRCFEASGTLPGTFDDTWQPTAEWECCTGNAQTSLVWQALGAATGDASWNEGARKLNSHLLAYQKVRSRLPGIDGAIPGSWPISGGYDPYAFPNHAAKFHIDALTLAPGARSSPAA